MIRFAVDHCSLGCVLVAATEKGICAIELGDEPAELEAGLRQRFSRADITQDGPDFASWVAQVVAFVEQPQAGLQLPLDIRGTAFQRRVWLALRQIAPGDTVTYGELAASLGKPKGARAVARACATNKIAVAIPCHRVVRTDGALGGYRWGLERKEALLEREAEGAAGD